MIVPIVGAPVHLTEMSSMWKQLWLPQPLCRHNAMSVSVPRQETSSNQISPLPELTCPRERPEYLHVIINHRWLSSTTQYILQYNIASTLPVIQGLLRLLGYKPSLANTFIHDGFRRETNTRDRVQYDRVVAVTTIKSLFRSAITVILLFYTAPNVLRFLFVTRALT